jgi:hypothetical protein
MIGALRGESSDPRPRTQERAASVYIDTPKISENQKSVSKNGKNSPKIFGETSYGNSQTIQRSSLFYCTSPVRISPAVAS